MKVAEAIKLVHILNFLGNKKKYLKTRRCMPKKKTNGRTRFKTKRTVIRSAPTKSTKATKKRFETVR